MYRFNLASVWAILARSFTEESWFRYVALEYVMPDWWGVVLLSGLLWGSAHLLFFEWPVAVLTALVGILFGWIYKFVIPGPWNFLVLWAVHFAFNMAVARSSWANLWDRR